MVICSCEQTTMFFPPQIISLDFKYIFVFFFHLNFIRFGIFISFTSNPVVIILKNQYLYLKIRLYTGKYQKVKTFTEKVKTHVCRKNLIYTGKSVKVKKERLLYKSILQEYIIDNIIHKVLI